jgi:hypothetical protein
MQITRGKATIRALDGSMITQETEIERETQKAILLKVTKLGKSASYWLPKSQLTFSGDKISIPDWLWEKRHES